MNWSWALFIVQFGILWGTWQAGNHKRWSWLMLAFTNIPWCWYGAVTKQWGFVAMGAMCIVIDLRNWRVGTA